MLFFQTLTFLPPKCLLQSINSKQSRNLEKSCENDQICSSNSRGHCDSGKCICYAGWTGDRCQIMINYCDSANCNEKFTKQCDIEPIVFTFKLAFTNLPDMDPWGGMDIYCQIKDGDGYFEKNKDGIGLGLTKTITSGQQENWVDVDNFGYGEGKRLIMADRVFTDYISLPKPLKICCFDEDLFSDDTIGCIEIDHKRLESNINNGSIWQDYSNFENPEKPHEAKLQILETITGTKSECTCKPGYFGETCNTPENFCENNSCILENTLNCIEQKSLQKYICECKPGFAGNFCEFEKNECSSVPCENGGTCIDKGVDDYECECLFGYKGENCLEADNFCNSSPCQNGAICKQYIGRYVCGCIDGWLGQNCDKEKDYCQGSTNKCLNGGICESDKDTQSFTEKNHQIFPKFKFIK